MCAANDDEGYTSTTTAANRIDTTSAERSDRTNDHNNTFNIPFYHKPRIVYGVVFVWIAVSGGRFITPFLEHECQLSASEIAYLFAIQQVLGIPANTFAGRYADRLESHYPGYGRSCTVAVGTTLATVIVLFHGLHHVVSYTWLSHFGWFLSLRIGYAVSVSLVFPVLDGMCIQFLQNQQQDYGKERLWGAVTWAITNVMLGPTVDRVGFGVTYPLTIMTYLAIMVTLYWYTVISIRIHTSSRNMYSALQKRNSSNVQLTRLSPKKLPVTLPDEAQQQEEECADDCIDDTSATDEYSGNNDIEIDGCIDNNEEEDGITLERDAIVRGNTSATSRSELIRRLLFGASPHYWYYGCCFILAVAMLASGQIIVDSLIFLYFEELGSSYTIMGWTVVLTVLFEIPVFSVADQLLQHCGSTNLLLIAMLCYIVRVMGYTLIPTGHVIYALLVEPMHGITYACSQTSIVDYVAQCMPPGHEATGQSFVYVIRGLGSVCGLVLSGWAETATSSRVLYRIAATIVSIGCSILATANYFRRRYPERQIMQLVPSNVDNEN